MIIRWIQSRIDPQATPIFLRLTNLQTPPSLEACVGLGAALFVINAAWGWIVFARSGIFGPGTIPALHVQAVAAPLSLIALGLLPLATVITTVALAAAERRRREDAPRRQPDPASEVAHQGVALAALHRLRVPLALGFGLVPTFAGAVGRSVVDASAAYDPTPLVPADLILPLLFFFCLGLALWATSFAAAALSADSLRRWASPALGVLLGLVTLAVLTVFPLLVLLALAGPALGARFSRLGPDIWPLMIITLIGAVVYPWALTLLGLLPSRRGQPRR